MGKHTEELHLSREKAMASAGTFFYTASALLIAAATAGCMAAGEDSSESLGQGAPESAATPLSSAPPATLSGCAPLCNGSCTPVMLANYWPAKDIALTSTDVFFSGGSTPYVNNGYVRRVPKAGGAATLILGNLAITPSVRRAGADVYVIGADAPLPGLLNRVNANGTFTAVPTSTGSPNFLTGDATHLYWVDSIDGNFYALALAGGSPAVVAQSGTPTKPLKALIDGDSLYWVNQPLSKKGWTLWKAPKAGGAAPTLLLSVQAGKFRSFAVDATDIYFIDYYTGVNKISKSGGAVTNIAYADEPGSHLVVDNERFYWIKDEVLTATCKDGSSDQVLTTETYITDDMAVDSSGLYWVQYYKVWKIAK